jgi:hypothetical protein
MHVNLPDEHVVGNIIEVAAVFQPGSRSRDVIRGALPFHFDQNDQIFQIFAVPLVKGFQELQSLRLGTDVYFDGAAVWDGFFVRVLSGIESFRGKFVTER